MAEPIENGELNPYAPTAIDSDVGRDPSEFLASLAALGTAHENDSIVPPGQRPCPICGVLMQARSRESIAIDVCPDHGIWLDSGKIESLTENISVSAKLKQRRDLEKVRNREKVKGMFGWATFFLD